MKFVKLYETYLNERSGYRSLVGQISKDIMIAWVRDWNQGDKSGWYRSNYDFPLELELLAEIKFTNTNKLEINGDARAGNRYETDDNGEFYEAEIGIFFEVGRDMLPRYWEEIYYQINYVLRHEIEHLTQDGVNWKSGKEDKDNIDLIMRELINRKLLPDYTYLMLPKEIPATIQGLSLYSKRKKVPLVDVVDTFLNDNKLKPEHKEEILIKWREAAKKIGGIPEF